MYNKNGLTMELITENGNKITEFTKDGLTFVEGRKGSEYKIKITNNTWTKIKVVISVDGLDILTGKRATPNAGGYVLNGYETQIINGWRISDEEIRKFFFSTQKNSYNSKTGNDTNNLGVIGIIGYKLHVEPVIQNYYSHTLDSGRYYLAKGMTENLNAVNTSGSIMNSTIFGSAIAQNASEPEVRTRGFAAVGTGMGKVEKSKVTKVYDTFESTPFASLMMYYKSKKELEAMGIKVAPVKINPAKIKPLPSAFEGYCKQV